MRKIFIFTTFFTLFLVSTLQAYFVNKDLTNLGPVADDIAVVLSGSEIITDHYDGYSSGPKQGRFSSFAWGPEGPNTLLHWQIFSDGDNNRIDNGQTIHVGWQTGDGDCKILDMYWTDPEGNRISGSVVHNITSGWTYETTSGRVVLDWENTWDEEVIITDIHWAVITEPIALSLLNYENTYLEDILEPLDEGEYIVVAPGEVVTREIVSSQISEDSYVVLRYDVFSASSQAYSTDFIQFQLAENDSNVYLSSKDDWNISLEKGLIAPLEEGLWVHYMEQWNNSENIIINEPYPDTTFLPADLFTWSGTYQDFVLYPGLVMAWGSESAFAEGEPYASAWTYKDEEVMDLSYAKISIIVFPPPGIENISFGLMDVNGNLRAWYWNVGDQLPTGMDTQIVISPNWNPDEGINATSPPASSYMTSPEFDISQVVLIMFDENGEWVAETQLPPPGEEIPRIWNYWRDLIILN